MRRRTAAFLLAALLVACIIPLATTAASGTVYFTGINDELLPLSSGSMPRYFDGSMYVPHSVFRRVGLGAVASQDALLVYKGTEKSLSFNISDGSVETEDGLIYFTAPAKLSGGTVYAPLEYICNYFGLTYSYISAAPASVVRICGSSGAMLNDKTFVGIHQSTMDAEYNAYFGTEPDPTDSVVTETPTTPLPDVSYSRVTLLPCFYGFEDGAIKDVLDILQAYGYKGTFYVTETDIIENADLLRRMLGEGHSIGIMLESGDLEEYTAASSLLFEATMSRTLLVSCTGNLSEAAETAAREYGLVFTQFERTFSGKLYSSTITDAFSKANGTAQILGFTCDAGVLKVMGSVISYISDYKYNVAPISEISA